MARFTVYAEVLTSEHPQMKAFASGVKKKLPGQTLREILQRNGGAYEAKAYFTPGFREQIRQVAELTSDDHLLSIAWTRRHGSSSGVGSPTSLERAND
jgi:hypothetical protein